MADFIASLYIICRGKPDSQIAPQRERERERERVVCVCVCVCVGFSIQESIECIWWQQHLRRQTDVVSRQDLTSEPWPRGYKCTNDAQCYREIEPLSLEVAPN